MNTEQHTLTPADHTAAINALYNRRDELERELAGITETIAHLYTQGGAA